jgi:predicted permease
MLAQFASIILPVAICAGVGFAWMRFGRAYDVALVTSLIMTVGAPCLAFHTLANLSVAVADIAVIAGAAAAAIALCAAAGAALLALAGLPRRAYLPFVAFANTGNMGLPLAYLAFGDRGLALAIGVFVVHSVTMFTFGLALTSGRLSPGHFARVPLLYAVALALVFMLSGITPPAWLNATTKLLGGITIPMMLITLGVALSRLGVGSLRISLYLALLRLGLGFTVALLLAVLLGLSGEARGVLILQLSMPVAVFSYLFAERFATAPGEVAGSVMLSTLISFVSLPALLWFVLQT